MTDTAVTAQTDADRALKQKHRAMWASGDYPTLASDLIWELGPRAVAAADVRPGERVLDVAAGSGNAAIPAALRGAMVVATDLAPELFDAGRRHATEAGAELEWREADAEALPFADDAFDVVLSTVGVMFAPHHQVAADELVRVVRPGGRIALISWTPEGFIGQMFKVMKPFAAPLPELPDEVGRERRVVARRPHGAVLLLQRAVGVGLRGHCDVGHLSSPLTCLG